MGQKKMPNQPLPADAAIGCRRTGVAWRVKKRWAEPHLSQPRPMHAKWPHATQCSQDAAEYDEDGYFGGARI